MSYGEIYNTTWWGVALDTARTAGTDPDFFGSQMKLLTSEQPELVTNGDFSNGTTGWSANNSILSVVNNKLKVLATGSFSYARQNITVLSGQTYKISVNFIHNSLIGNIEAYDGTTNLVSEQLSEDGLLTLLVTPNSTNIRLTLLNRNGVSGDFNYWDNVSIQLVRCDLDQIEAKKCLADWIHTTALQDLNN